PPKNASLGLAPLGPSASPVEIRALSFTINAETVASAGEMARLLLRFRDCQDYMANLLVQWNRLRSETRPISGLRLFMPSSRFKHARALLSVLAASAVLGLGISRANAEAVILVDVDSGKVLHAENATVPWYPASVTKIMTTYVTLRALKEGR